MSMTFRGLPAMVATQLPGLVWVLGLLGCSSGACPRVEGQEDARVEAAEAPPRQVEAGRDLPGEPDPAGVPSGPLDLVSREGGAFLVWASPGAGGGSRVQLRALDAEGRAVGPDQALLTLPGRVERVQAARHSEGVAVGWCSVVEQETERFGVVFVDEGGAVTRAEEGIGPDRSLPPGAAPYPGLPSRGCGIDLYGDHAGVVVATRHGRWMCRDEASEQEVPCGLLSVLRVAPHGGTGAIREREVTTTPMDEPLSIVATRYYVAWATNPAGVPEGRAVRLQRRVPWCGEGSLYGVCSPRRGCAGLSHLTGLEARLVWTGETLVAMGREIESGELRATGWSDDCRFARLPELDPPDRGWMPIVSQSFECEEGRPRVVWQLGSGERHVLDPLAEGASFRWTDLLRSAEPPLVTPRAAAWTGSSLLVIGEGGDGPSPLTVHPCRGLGTVPGS